MLCFFHRARSDSHPLLLVDVGLNRSTSNNKVRPRAHGTLYTEMID